MYTMCHLDLEDANLPAKWHANALNGFKKVQECDRRQHCTANYR